MRPRDITDADLAYWADTDPRAVMFTAPGEVDDGITPAPGLITNDVRSRHHAGNVDELCDDRDCPRLHVVMVGNDKVCRVALTLDAGDRERVAAGADVWLSTWGYLPVFMVEVAEP